MSLFRPFLRARRLAVVALALAPVIGLATQIAPSGPAAAASGALVPGNLLVATSVFQNDSNIVAGKTQLPPECFVAATLASSLTANSTYMSLAVSSLAQAVPTGYSLVISDNVDTATPQTLTVAASAPASTGATTISVDSFKANTAYSAGTATVTSAYDPCGTAIVGGTYPQVFNNDSVDGSFGISSEITLNQLTPSGTPVSTIQVPNTGADSQLVTSFSSKSELALNLSTSGKYVTFMGYDTGVDTADASNSNTPGEIDPTASDVGPFYRVVGQLGQDGTFKYTRTNAFSGDNGRVAILDDEPGTDQYLAAGNAGNGANPEPAAVVTGAGAQLITPSDQPESEQTGGTPVPVGSFSVTQLGDAADKLAKDDNFRGMTIFNNVLYYTKGSGGNGIDTVYFVDTTGKACPTGGVGLPVPGAALPTMSVIQYVAQEAGTAKKPIPGLAPENMCILAGLPTNLVPSSTSVPQDYPFGIWFANPNTLYVADEGSGDNTNTTFSATSNGLYSVAADFKTAGLQKWVFDPTTKEWTLAYTLQNGLNLGVPYLVPNYPTGLNDGPGGTGMPWAPATDGLRNITGQINPNGTATIWAETSTVSGSGDQGADPNELVSITDNLGATSIPAAESFKTVIAPANATVVRGVSFTPGTNTTLPGNLTCNGTYSQSTIGGNIDVPAGSTCTLVNATVQGNVKVDNGGSLFDTNSTIDGNVQPDGAAWIDIDGGTINGNLQVKNTTGNPDVGTSATANDICGVTVTGNLQVQNNDAAAAFDIGAAPDCTAGLTIDGNLQVQNNDGKVLIGAPPTLHTSAAGNVQVQNNNGGGTLTNTVDGGNCQLQNNTPGIVGSANTAKGNNSCNVTA